MKPAAVNKPVHAQRAGFPVAGAELEIGGIKLTRLAERVGSTPFYAYDRALIAGRVAALRSALPADVKLHYSIKANPMPAVVQLMSGLADGLDVASGGELATALDTGFDPRHISFAGPGKSTAELRRAIAAGACLNVESSGEIERIAQQAESLGLAPRVVLRVNPEFELKASGMRMGGGAKPFGIDAERVPDALVQLRACGIAPLGLHIFCGSQSLKTEAIAEAHARSFELALHLFDGFDSVPQMLNMGAGFGIPYFPGERALDLAPVAANLADWMPRVRERLGALRVSLEAGRYLVGEAGIYVARVVERKESRGQVFLVTDGGLHHHLAASGNFGQVIRKNYPAAIGNRMDAALTETETVTVVGPLCTPLDVLAERMELPVAQAGDLLVVFQSGAYGLSASPTAFLGHPAPAEVLV
ncbi:pyridoxal-dependent decarboxylase, exosortase A system-associated [Massilia alkalitolerans]|uniref:pyridoxal-dependent decarboxylase, exosortase A system-associated n=1 Tax=Massilia alkalitolerans TaxID=286638 RepID=UPI0028ADADF4|nr:pyridoxal-dependent decarboxylase, exosortase A system-associated [Massilia alkalitolerans]